MYANVLKITISVLVNGPRKPNWNTTTDNSLNHEGLYGTILEL